MTFFQSIYVKLITKFNFFYFRVPVRKPGINNGEIFNSPSSPPQQLSQNHKTLSVPNLLQISPQLSLHPSGAAHTNRMVPLPPAPPPPPPPPASIPPLHKPGNIYSTPSTTHNAPIRNYTVQNSASNDTLVQEDSISNEVDNYENDDGVIEYEPPHDYNENDDDCSLDRKDNDSESNYSSHIEPAIDYDQANTFASNKAPMSTFNNKQPANSAPNNNNNNNLILMMLNSGNKGTNASPLTPRQIKQRNSAKRNSIPRSSSSNPSPPNANPSSSHSVASLTPTQQRDLAFLQTQKFDAEFMQTTRDLFLKYPNAKISISVTVSTTQTSPDHSIQQQTQTNRQIEINRDMFEKICAFQTQKVQPQTPIRTTSISTASNSNNYNSMSSSSSSSPNSSSSSSSAYDSSSMPSECAPPMPPTPASLKNEDLNEAIRKAAAEHMLKRQSSANSINCNQESSSNRAVSSSQTNINSGHVSQLKQQLNHQSCILPSAAVKNELERAIENRLKRTNLQQQQNAENSATNVTPSSFLNKRNVPRDPPPPLPACALNKTSFVSSTVPPPPPPPLPQAELGSPSQSTLFSNNSANSFPPPPSPTVLHRLSNIDISGSSNKNGPTSPIPPPPPPPPLPNTTAPVAKELTQQITPTASVQARTNNVKSIVNNYQQSQIQLLDPRSSSNFSELIAKKAAEKRAKFQENKPSANAVTFQPDGSKVFTASSTNINNTNQTKQSNSIENQAKPKIYTTSKANTTTTTTTAPPLVNSLKKQSSTESSNSISNHTVTPSKLLLGNAQQASSQITTTMTTSNSGM